MSKETLTTGANLIRTRRSSAVLLIALSVSSVLAIVDGASATPSCAASNPGGGEWRSFGHDLANTRSQADETGITPSRARTLAPVWTFSVIDAGGTSDVTETPIVADGCVFVATNSGWVFGINADNGRLVWKTNLSDNINSTLAVANGLVYAHVSRSGSPYLAALDEFSGAVVWKTVLTKQAAVQIFSSPVAFNGMVFTGLTGGNGNGVGGFALTDALTGSLIKRGWTIPPDQWAQGYAGGTILSTAAVDAAEGYAYAGTGSGATAGAPMHPNVDALIKIDVDPRRPTFGTVVGSYNGLVGKSPVVVPEQNLHGSPNIFTDSNGRKLVGGFHKSGVYFMVDADTMQPVRVGVGGLYFPLGGSSTATEGKFIFGSSVTPGHVYSMSMDTGLLNWAAPTLDLVHIAHPVQLANNVLYTIDAKGFLDAYDAGTGRPLLHRPMTLGSGTGTDPVVTWGAGVSIARHTLYAAIGMGLGSLGAPVNVPNGYVIAFRPDPSIPDLPTP